MSTGCNIATSSPDEICMNMDERTCPAHQPLTCSAYAHIEADSPHPATRGHGSTMSASPITAMPPCGRTHQALAPVVGFTTESTNHLVDDELSWRRCCEQQIKLGLRSDLANCSGQFDCYSAEQTHDIPFDGPACQPTTAWLDEDTEHDNPPGYVVHLDISKPGQAQHFGPSEQQGQQSPLTNAITARQAQTTPFAATVVKPESGFVKIEHGIEQQWHIQSTAAEQPETQVAAAPDISYSNAIKKRRLAAISQDTEHPTLKKQAGIGTGQPPITQVIRDTVQRTMDSYDGKQSQGAHEAKDEERRNVHITAISSWAVNAACSAIQQNSLADKQHVQTLYLIANVLHQALQLVGYTQLEDWGIFAVMEPAGWRYKYCWKGRVYHRLQDAIHCAVTTQRRQGGSSSSDFPPVRSLLDGNPSCNSNSQQGAKPNPLPAATILGQPIVPELSHDGAHNVI